MTTNEGSRTTGNSADGATPVDIRRETSGELSVSALDRTLIVKRAFAFLSLIAIVWCILFFLDQTFYYVRPGAKAIYEAKLDYLQNKAVLPADPAYPIRVMIFGNSRILAGFKPELFDENIGAGCHSYNAGLPDSDQFVFFLEKLFSVGNRPTHILVQMPWAGPEADLTLRQWFQQDASHIEWLFPFRKLPRNLLSFIFQSRRHGGLVRFYKHCENETLRMLDQRGYYFIAGQSHFPDHRLPPTYALSTDTPNKQKTPRAVSTASRSFASLASLAEQFDFQVFLVPDQARMHAYAQAPPQDEASILALSGFSRFHVLGPTYWQYENRMFADPVHLNEEGAELYTRQLAAMLRSELKPR